MTPTEIAEELGRSGLCVCRDFLSPAIIAATRADIKRVQNQKGFHRAGVGHNSDHGVHDDIRRDEVHWLERTAADGDPQTPLWKIFDNLQTAFNRTLFLGLTDFEAHYAAYPIGGFYQRHRDAFRDNLGLRKPRVVSVIIYLTENWNRADGGQLRVYNDLDATHIDIDPMSGTLVCFMSQDSEHEVLPSAQRRLSLAGWFTRG